MTCQPGGLIFGENYKLASSTTRPTGVDLFTGLMIFEGDTGRTMKYDGVGWFIVDEPANTFSTFTVTSQTGTITTVGVKVGAYTRSNGFCDFTFSAVITTNGTGASWVNVGLPVQALNVGLTYEGAGREASLTGNMLQVIVSGGTSTAIVTTPANAYPAGSGATLQGTIRYPMVTRYS